MMYLLAPFAVPYIIMAIMPSRRWLLITGALFSAAFAELDFLTGKAFNNNGLDGPFGFVTLMIQGIIFAGGLLGFIARAASLYFRQKGKSPAAYRFPLFLAPVLFLLLLLAPSLFHSHA